ncbi:MAG: alpha-glucosidase [Paenibacillaceae bacterium]|jgi:alpha-glucosidase (family GH31 glycosyl hydrolase)|nr:alpha-glucosidase [Paenibacillaceae bacterium]
MKQRLHPDITWTAPYGWKEADLSGHEPVTGFVSAQRLGERNEWLLQYKEAAVVCSVHDSSTIRLQLLPEAHGQWTGGGEKAGTSGAVINPGLIPTEAQTAEDADRFCIITDGLRLELAKAVLSFRLLDHQGRELLGSHCPRVKRTDNGFSTYAPFELTDDDRFFGFGGRTSPPGHRGATKDMFAVKVAHERGDYGGFPMPFFMNPRGYGLMLDNPWPHVYFDLGYEREDSWFFYTPDGPLDLYLITGEKFSRILQGYYQLTGWPVLPHKAYFGLWYSWARSTAARQWEEWARRLREEKWPADAIVLDLYWRGGLLALDDEAGDGCNLMWDGEGFGDGPGLIRQLHEWNYLVGLHVNTRMYSEPLLSEGLRRGALRQAPEQQVVPVFGNREHEEWNWSHFAPRVVEGADFWWTDNGERVDGELTDGLPSRNLFGQRWNGFIYEGMTAMGVEGRPVLARGGWMGAHRCTLPWPGDTTAGVDRIREDMWYTMNLGMSGMLFSSVDLGGFREMEAAGCGLMTRDENMIRRVIHGFFLTSTLRIHAGGEEHYGKFPWQLEPRVQALFRYFLELRYRLLPYIYSAAVQGVKQAVPLLRPLGFDYSADPGSLANHDELLLGPSMLVAPVMEEGREERSVYLPPGQWTDFWTNRELAGGRSVIVDAPLYEHHGLPLFIAAGSIIPYRPLAQFNAGHDERIILLDLYMGPNMSYSLWEAEARASEIRVDRHGGRVVIHLENRTDQTREYAVRCRGGHSLLDARIDGKPLEEDGDGRFRLTVDPSERAEVYAALVEPSG